MMKITILRLHKVKLLIFMNIEKSGACERGWDGDLAIAVKRAKSLSEGRGELSITISDNTHLTTSDTGLSFGISAEHFNDKLNTLTPRYVFLFRLKENNITYI